MENLIKVSSKSNPNSVAGAIAGILKEHREVMIDTVGAGSVNQAVKAIAIARGFVAPVGKNIVCVPSFNEVVIEDEERTGIRFIVKYEV